MRALFKPRVLAPLPSSPPSQEGSATPGEVSPGHFAPASPGSAGPNDVQLLNRMLSGELGVDAGLRFVSHSGGWPIRTPTGYLFACPDEGQGPVSVAGDFNGWKPAPMQKKGELYYLHVPVGEGAGGRYKLVDAQGEMRADPWARRYDYDEHGEISITNTSEPHLERWPQLGDSKVRPRTVRVWVPAEPPTHHLYVQDGQNLFDPEAMWGGWHLQDQVGPRTLVVGIDNTPDRMEELTPFRDRMNGEWIGGRGDDYAFFLHDTVQPFIEARYGKPKRLGVMGSSLGGLMALHLAHRFPHDYDFAASLSGTLGFGAMEAKGETILDRFREAPVGRAVLYLDSGGEPGRDNFDPTVELTDILATAGYQWRQNLFHWYEPGAPHTEAAWAARAWRPIRVFEEL